MIVLVYNTNALCERKILHTLGEFPHSAKYCEKLQTFVRKLPRIAESVIFRKLQKSTNKRL